MQKTSLMLLAGIRFEAVIISRRSFRGNGGFFIRRPRDKGKPKERKVSKSDEVESVQRANGNYWN